MAVSKNKKRIMLSLSNNTINVLETLSANGISKSEIVEASLMTYLHQIKQHEELKRKNALQQEKEIIK